MFKQQPLKRTHDLVTLTRLCVELDADFTPLLVIAAELNPYVTGARYPDDCFVMPDVSIALHNMLQASIILDFVKNKTS